jgi:hypothetical protein
MALAPEIVARAVELQLITPTEAARFLVDDVAAHADRPFVAWSSRRRLEYAIEVAAASGAPAELPMRPLRPGRHVVENLPHRRKRLR